MPVFLIFWLAMFLVLGIDFLHGIFTPALSLSMQGRDRLVGILMGGFLYMIAEALFVWAYGYPPDDEEEP